MTNLNEMWDIPSGAVDTGYIFADGRPIYSSDKLKLKFFKALLKTEAGKKFAPTLKNLIEKKRIIPAYLSKGVFNFLSRKMFSKDFSKRTMGSYDIESNRIYVFIDNMSSWAGVSLNNQIAEVTLHECSHMSSKSNFSGYYKIAEHIFKEFYKNYFDILFQCEGKVKNINKILAVLKKSEQGLTNTHGNQLAAAVSEEIAPLSTFDHTTTVQLLKDFYFVVKVFSVSSSLRHKYFEKYKHIIGPLTRAYETLTNDRYSNYVSGQELWSLSEITAMLTNLNPTEPLVGKILKNIK